MQREEIKRGQINRRNKENNKLKLVPVDENEAVDKGCRGSIEPCTINTIPELDKFISDGLENGTLKLSKDGFIIPSDCDIY